MTLINSSKIEANKNGRDILYETTPNESDGLKAVVYSNENARFPYLVSYIDLDANEEVTAHFVSNIEDAIDRANRFAYGLS